MQKLLISLGMDLSDWKDGVSKAKKQYGGLVKGVTSGLKKIGVGAVMMAASATGLYGMTEGVVNQSRTFETLQTKVGATSSQMKALRGDVYELNSALGLRSVSDAADKIGMVAKLSRKTGDELKQLTYQTGLLGKEFGEEEEQLKAQLAMMAAFKSTVGEAGDAVAFLNKQGGDMKGELLESIKEYSVQFAEAGFNLNQTVAIIQQGLDKGWNVDKAADAFKEGRLRLMGGDKATVDALKLLGLGDLDGQIKKGLVSIPHAMSQIQGELSKLNKTEQFRIAKDIFGNQYEDVGETAMTAMLTGMNKKVQTAGTIDLMTKSLEDRFSHKWDTAISNLGNSFSEMIESIKPHLVPIVEWFSRITSRVTAFSQKYQYIMKTIAVGIAGFTALAGVLGILSVAVGVLGIAFNVLTSPITLIILAIVAVGAGLYFLEKKTGIVSLIFGKWLDIVSGCFSRIKETIGAVADLFENGFSIDGLLNVMEKAAKTILTPFDTLFGTDLTELFKDTVKGWGNSLFDVLMSTINKIKNSVVGFCDDFILFGAGLDKLFMDTISSWGSSIYEELMAPINKIRKSAVGRFLFGGYEDKGKPKISAKNIRGQTSDPNGTRKPVASSGWFGTSFGNQKADSAPAQKTTTINIGSYHSNSRNAAADWETMGYIVP